MARLRQTLLKHRRIKIWHLILLLLLIDSSIFGVFFWQNIMRTLNPSISYSNVGMAIKSHSITKAHTTIYSSPNKQYQQLANLYVQHMNLDEKLGQLIIAQFDGSAYSTDLETMISQQHIGGVILFANQIHTISQIQADTARMQSHAQIPLLIGTDQEGLTVNRLASIYGSDSLAAQAMGQAGNPDVAHQEGKKIAQRLLKLGMNVNFAPDIDVGISGGYIDKDLRDFGHTPSDVIIYAGAYVRGLQSTGVIGCFKHFPGLGDVARNLDPHSILPTVNADKDHIYTNDLAPFQHFIQSKNPQEQPEMIMATDVLMPAIDAQFPAELSHSFISDILRRQLGYDGVVTSDSLHMQGVAIDGQHLGIGQAAVLAIRAGVDIALNVNGSREVAQVINALKTALQDSTVTQARIDEAATRIIALKMQHHLLSAAIPV